MLLTRETYRAIFRALLHAQFVLGDAAAGALLHTPEYYARKKAEVDRAFEQFAALPVTFAEGDDAGRRHAAVKLQELINTPVETDPLQ